MIRIATATAIFLAIPLHLEASPNDQILEAAMSADTCDFDIDSDSFAKILFKLLPDVVDQFFYYARIDNVYGNLRSDERQNYCANVLSNLEAADLVR